MRLNINLASHPYQDLNRFLQRWMIAVGVFAVASLALALFAWHQYSAGREINRQIREQQKQIQQSDEQKAAAVKMLAEPSNKEVADTAHYLNLLIAKKAFSWTRVFMQMEEIMPGRLHVLSMTPELTQNNQLLLTMRVAGDSREQAVELVRRIEKSPSFRTASLKSEAMIPPDQAKGGDSVMFEINALYVPKVAPAAVPVNNKSVAAEGASAPAEKNSQAANAAKGVRP
jgi:type IV pilus assembly protein PilN